MSENREVNISDEAVEAAARVSYEQSRPAIPWEYMMPWWRDAYMGNLRIVLEAAAPHIMAAWISDTSRLPRDLPGYGPEGSVGAGE